MKKVISIVLLLFNLGQSIGQSNVNLEYEFDKARALLAQRKTLEAIESLRLIYIDQPDNANINFLMGAAYAESVGNSEKAIFHLKKAMKQVSTEYIVGSFMESNAPIHVYYYMTLALVELDQCAEANYMLEKLKKNKGRLDQYFIDEASRNMEKCPFDPKQKIEEWLKSNEKPVDYKPDSVLFEEEIELDSAALAQRGLLVQHLDYSTEAPLYGVQIGSNVNPSPISNYGKVKNVDVFVDNKGIIRYVVGHFSYRSQAETLLKSLIQKGYEDAFIVNVNDEKKYSNELISYNNVNIRAGIKGEVSFYIQLGAFKETIPDSIINLYHQIDNIKEMKYDEFTLLLIGKFLDYHECLNKSEDLKKIGNSNFFIVAFNNRKKIPLQEAINYSR